MESIEAVHFSKCRSIEPVLNEDTSGPICKSNYCMRNCKDGFKPIRPKKVRQNITSLYYSVTTALIFRQFVKKVRKDIFGHQKDFRRYWVVALKIS